MSKILKDIDYTSIDYSSFKKSFRTNLNELESAAGAADEEKAAKLQQDKAKIDQQIAQLQQKKAAIQKQIDAIEKK
jgi:cell division protein FtsB